MRSYAGPVPSEGFEEQDPLTQYVENYIAPSVSILVAEADTKNIKTPAGTGPDSNKPVSSILNTSMTEIRRVAGLYRTAPAEQKQGLINNINVQNIATLNRIASTFQLTSVPALTPYTAEMTLPTVSSSAPSAGAGAAGSSAAGAAAANTIVGSGGAGQASEDYDALVAQARTGAPAVLSSNLQTILRQVQASAQSSDGTAPGLTNLLLAQGGGVVHDASGSDASGNVGTYTAHQQRIYPHQLPPATIRALQALLPSDRGTQAEQIMQGAVLTPSVRNEIRNDVREAVASEMANIRNNYEVQFVTADA